MATISLTGIQEAVSKKYAPLVVELAQDEDGNVTDKVSLRQALRLSKTERDQLAKLQNDRVREARIEERAEKARLARVEAGTDDDSDLIDVSDDTTLDYFKAFIRIVADTSAGADRLFEAVGEDVALLGEIVTEYAGSTQVGEASSSES